MRAHRRFAASTVAVVVLAGCSGGSGGAAGGAALTKSQLDTQANAICVAEQTAGKQVAAPDDISDIRQTAAYFDKIDPIIQSATDKLAALTPDGGEAAAWEAFLSARKAFSRSMHDVRLKADAGEESAVSELENLSTDRLAAAAAAVGASSCGETG